MPTGAQVVPAAKPTGASNREFLDVLETRRSGDGGPIDWDQVAMVLWYACRTYQYREKGRAGIEVEQRAAPSAGGLHVVQVVCQSSAVDERPRLYLPARHAFAVLNDSTVGAPENAEDVVGCRGRAEGCTMRLIADMSKIDAAYSDGESLAWRDAGALGTVICLVCEWLGLSSRMLGLIGNRYAAGAGFPSDRFQAVGAVHVSGGPKPG